MKTPSMGLKIFLAGAMITLYGAGFTVNADESRNIELIGYHNMQGRQALQVNTKSDSANGNWVYVGHVPNTRTRDATLNPITGVNEWNGTSILDITDPTKPELVWHIPNEGNANSRFVGVVYDYGFDSDPVGRDYLIRNSEVGDDLKFQIFEISDIPLNCHLSQKKIFFIISQNRQKLSKNDEKTF